MEHWTLHFVPGAILVIPHQRISPGCKLHPDLVRAPGVQQDMHQCRIALGQPGEFQTRPLDPLALPLDHKDLIFAAVFEEKILPCFPLGRDTVYQRPVFLDKLPLLHQPGQRRRCRRCAGIDHDPAHIQIQPVDGVHPCAKGLLQHPGQVVLRVHAHQLDHRRQIRVLV